MVALLVAAQEATARTARDLLPLVAEANDQPTTDLLTQRLDVHEKTAWMLRSLLEDCDLYFRRCFTRQTTNARHASGRFSFSARRARTGSQ